MSLQFYGKRISTLPLVVSAGDPEVEVLAATRGKAKKIRPNTRKVYRRKPGHWSSGLVLHTTKGTVNKETPGLISSVLDWIYSESQVNTSRDASWHVQVDLDASAIQSVDAGLYATWHAGQVNLYADGWELVQGPDRNLTTGQLDLCVELIDEWTWQMGVPRIIPWDPRTDRPYAGMLSAALTANGAGKSLCMVYGHRNVWGLDKHGNLKAVRGAGDPSDEPFEALAAAGYLRMDVEGGEYHGWIKEQQRRFGLAPDGIAGPQLRSAWIREGRPGGMLVSRPSDAARGTPIWYQQRLTLAGPTHG